jgi:hypothetical protein
VNDLASELHEYKPPLLGKAFAKRLRRASPGARAVAAAQLTNGVGRRYDKRPLTSHATFLAPDGRKAAIEPVRLFPAGASPAGGGVGFPNLGGRRELIVAEGIESALSAAKLYDAEAAVATLSSMAWVQRRPLRCAPSALRRARTCGGKLFLSCRTTSAS